MMKAKKADRRHRVHAQGITVSAGFLLALSLGLAFRGNGQIAMLKPLHLSHIQGVVTDRAGRPIAKAEVALVRGGSVAFRTTTDDSGRFSVDKASGRYWFRVSGPRYSPAAREVIIATDLETVFRRVDLYVVLGPGSCVDECSPIFGSKKDFDRALRWNTGHYY